VGVGVIRVITAHPKLRADSRILLIGDSLAQGLNPQLKALARDERVTYEGRGISGSRIDQWAKNPWLDQTLASYQPTLILVSLGTNDAYMQGDVWERQRPALERLLDKLEASGAEVVWITPPTLPVVHNGMRVDAGFLDTLSREAPNVFDSTALNIPRGPDGLHPNVAGLAGWAGALWAWLS